MMGMYTMCLGFIPSFANLLSSAMMILFIESSTSGRREKKKVNDCQILVNWD